MGQAPPGGCTCSLASEGAAVGHGSAAGPGGGLGREDTTALTGQVTSHLLASTKQHPAEAEHNTNVRHGEGGPGRTDSGHKRCVLGAGWGSIALLDTLGKAAPERVPPGKGPVSGSSCIVPHSALVLPRGPCSALSQARALDTCHLS